MCLKRLRKLLCFPINLVLIGTVRLYQLTVSPFLGKRCRFHPSCSHYAIEALNNRGPFKGAWLILRRLLKCHPFHPGGIDLVPHQRINE